MSEILRVRIALWCRPRHLDSRQTGEQDAGRRRLTRCSRKP